MGDRHKQPPLYFRPGVERGDPAGDRAWLLAHAEKTGRPYGAMLAEALSDYRERTERGTSSSARSPGTATPDIPPAAIAAAAIAIERELMSGKDYVMAADSDEALARAALEAAAPILAEVVA